MTSTDRGRRLRFRSVHGFVAAQLALAAVLVLGTLLLVLHLRERALAGAEHELGAMSLVLANQAERGFESVALVQTGLLDHLKTTGMRSADDFRRMTTGLAVHEELANRTATLPQLDAITMIDTAGNLLNFSRYWPVPKVNVADRDYFKALVADPGRGEFIGQPVQNRGTGTWTIYLARAATAPDGTLAGIILAAVQLSYFETLYQDVASDETMGISLFRRDGTLLARYPRMDGQIGQSFSKGLAFMQPQALASGHLVVRQSSPIDGQERMIADHAMVNFPMVVNVTNKMSSILAEWRHQAMYLAAAAVLLELVMATIGLMMMRQMRSQRLLDQEHAARIEAEAAHRAAAAELTLVHEQEKADRLQRMQELRFGAALANMSQGLCMFDAADHLVVANSRLAEMFNAPHQDVMQGMSIEALLSRLQAHQNLGSDDISRLRDRLQQFRQNQQRADQIMDFSDGRSLSVNFAPMADGGWLATMEDITHRRAAEARITYMAHHDALTGLANRVQFHARLGAAVAQCHFGETAALLYLDLDHFKSVNDTLGHPLGDALLREVTSRLHEQVRESDMIARLGGDEFAIVLSMDQPDDARVLAERLIAAISAPYELDGHQVIIGTSIGIALVPDDGDDTDILLKNADLALYRAKAEGRGRYSFFAPEMDAQMQARRTMEIDLREALKLGQFQVYYQPLMNLKTRQVTGFEALLRWHHPIRGMVSPSEFIPIAEEMGLIVALGNWALRQACADAATWPGNQTVAVNLSAVQFGSRTLVDDVAAALRDSGLEANRLELEITETVMLQDTDAALVVLHHLRDLGVDIAMDDFGTGYSSLSYLRRFPFDKVKIDKSFVDGLGNGGDCDAIVRLITELCAHLGMKTTAEGVETEEQLQQLFGGACTQAQGFLFSRPRPASEVAELCRTLNARGDMPASAERLEAAEPG